MPLLARAKRRVGNQLHSSAAVQEASQSMLCAYFSVALLAGLLLNGLAGWWWADPARGARDRRHRRPGGTQSWRGEGCCDDC